MALRGIKVKEGEDLSPSNVQRVVEALESDKPITKKEACGMLNIAYNTTRLNKIIQEYKDRISFVANRKAQMRSKPIDIIDKKQIVQEYLSGTSINEIAEGVYRSTAVVKNVLKRYNIPIRNKAYSYFDPVFLEEDSSAEDYIKGDLVFSARYNSPAYVENLHEITKLEGSVYKVWILGDHSQWAYQPYYELADLRKLQKELDIKIQELDGDEIRQLIYDGLQKAKKLKKV